MRQPYGQWLREHRQARGWSVPELRRRLREAARQAGDKLPENDSLTVMIYRWEDDRSGISERYRLHYCRAFGIPIAEFGERQPEFPVRQPEFGERKPEFPVRRPEFPVQPLEAPPADAARMLAEAAPLLLLGALEAWGIVPDLTAAAPRMRTARHELNGHPRQ